jgi:hypothetical protein
MTWKNIRLELARTQEFPQGSASRAYLLRLPVDDDGLINEAELRTLPGRATVRRFWPNEPDMSGYVIQTPRGWAFSYRIGEEDDEAIFHLETHRICAGEYITLTEPDGRQLPFRVASVDPITQPVATSTSRAA